MFSYFQESINWNTKAVLSNHVRAGNMNLNVMRNESENCGQLVWQVTITYSPQLVANDALLGERHYNPPQLIFLPYTHLKQVVLYIKQLLYKLNRLQELFAFCCIAQQLVCSFSLIFFFYPGAPTLGEKLCNHDTACRCATVITRWCSSHCRSF